MNQPKEKGEPSLLVTVPALFILLRSGAWQLKLRLQFLGQVIFPEPVCHILWSALRWEGN
jgi:hypothetical protein